MKNAKRKPLATPSAGAKKKKRPGPPKEGITLKIPVKFRGQDPRVEFHSPPRRGIESAVPPDDEASKHQYPPPGNDPTFRAKWMLFIDNIVSRANFNVGHLETLRVFCNLIIEYDEIMQFLRENGRSYCSVGRSGEVWRLYPEVQHLKRVESSIKDYSKLLDLILKKDHGSDSGGEADEWK